MTAKHLLDQIVRGLDGVTAGPWRREALGGASTVLAKSKPPRDDTRAASYGYRDEEYCLAHPFLDDDNQPRMDFVCFGHADAAHIARCSPDAIREIAAYVRDLEERLATATQALEPVGNLAMWTETADDEELCIMSVGTIRKMRGALEAIQIRSEK